MHVLPHTYRALTRADSLSLPPMHAAWTALSLSLLLPLQVAAQNLPITALPFLEIPPSPAINAMGGAGVAFPSSDPHAFLFNPAQLGISARDTRAAGTLFPGGSTDWLAIGDLSVSSTALSAGVDLRPLGMPLVAGIGLGQTALQFGERVMVDDLGEAIGSYKPRDRYRALSIGVASAGAARIGMGTTVRYVSSTDRASVENERLAVSNLRGFTFDLGVLAEADITRLLGQPSFGRIRPTLSIGAGYDQSNIGGTITYNGQFAASALPRTARLGWSASGGIAVPLKTTSMQFFQADVSVQAEHLLVRENGVADYTYEPFLGGMNVIQNGLLGRGSATVTGRHGYRIAFLESFSISWGGFDGWGFDDAKTRGVEFSLAGPLKIIGAVAGNARLADLANHYDVRFTHSVYFYGLPNESTFNGISFVVKR